MRTCPICNDVLDYTRTIYEWEWCRNCGYERNLTDNPFVEETDDGKPVPKQTTH